MKVKVDKFTPLKQGGISISLTAPDEAIAELVSMLRHEANLTLATDEQQDKIAYLKTIKVLLEDIKTKLEEKLLCIVQ